MEVGTFYTEIMKYVKPELIVVIPVLCIIGVMLKNTEIVKDKYIPLILTAVSLVVVSIYVLGSEGVNTQSIFTAIIQSVLCAAVAVYVHQLYKQSKE